LREKYIFIQFHTVQKHKTEWEEDRRSEDADTTEKVDNKTHTYTIQLFGHYRGSR